jgi:NADH-quinone oxidoreductase subunit N
MSYFDLFILLIPEAAMTVAALVILGLDLGLMRDRPVQNRLRMAAVLTTLGCLVAGAWLVAFDQPGSYDHGMVVINGLNRLVKVLLLVLTGITAWLSLGSTFTEHVGEYFVLLLLATVGMMFLAGTENLLMVFLALELLSLSLYILTAFDKRSVPSAEAALKYFLFGGMSAAFMLFGLSLVYGLSGELELSKIAQKLGSAPLNPLLVTATIMIVIGFGFKVAAVPFHLWAPDTYQGAPIPSAAFIASGSKVASFYILAKVMMVGFAGAEGDGGAGHSTESWIPLLAVVAALSVMLGNLAALAQSSVRRLLAYSAVAQAGYILVGLAADSETGLASVLYYTATYALTILGAFGVVGLVQDRTGSENLEAFSGLSRRAPVVSFCLMIFLLSLAGIPPLAGFFGKFYLFTAALAGSGKNMGLLWLVILAVGMSAVSLYYYLKVLKQVFVVKPAPQAAALPVSVFSRFVLLLLALAVVVLGCAPNLLLAPLLTSIRAVSH